MAPGLPIFPLALPRDVKGRVDQLSHKADALPGVRCMCCLSSVQSRRGELWEGCRLPSMAALWRSLNATAPTGQALNTLQWHAGYTVCRGGSIGRGGKPHCESVAYLGDRNVLLVSMGGGGVVCESSASMEARVCWWAQCL